MTTTQQTAANLRRKKQEGSTVTSVAGDVIDVTRKLMILDPQILVENRIVTELCGLLEADHAVLLLRDDDGKLLIQAERLNEDQHREMAVSQTVLKLVLDTGEAFYSPNALKDERLMGGDSVVALDLQAVAATPLIGSSGTIIGVLYLATYGQHSHPPRLAAEENLPLLQAVANVAATALENAWLYSNDQQFISHRQQIEARVGTPAVSEEELLAHGLGGYLTYLRIRSGYSMREVEELTKRKIKKSWLSRAERGDIGEPIEQQSRLIILAKLFNAPPEQLLLMAGLDMSVEFPASFQWAEETIRQHPEAISLIHKVSTCDPTHQNQLISLLNHNCDWFMENLPSKNKNP
jgi:transcriptional regulator with XRE-family HTH domain